MMRLTTLVCILLLFFACTEDSRTKRPDQRLLLIGTAAQNTATDPLLAKAYQQLTEQQKLDRVDTTTQISLLQENYLKTYSALVLLGNVLEQLSPQTQSAIERYVQAGGGLLLAHPPAAQPYRWPFYQQIAEQADGQQEWQGGRIVKGPLPLSTEQVQFAIGDNSYDYTLATSPLLPEFDRFTKVPLDTKMNEPMELTVLPNGSVLYIERRGKMKLYNNISKSTSLIHEFDVCTAGNYEDGLLGLALDPGYGRDNRWLWLYYSPPCDTLYQLLSRFDFYDDSLDVSSETPVLKVDVQRETCCHSGGSIAFDSNGLLYLSTGDNTSSKESDGFSPLDERPGRAPFDAQKSSGNTHDLRGKIIRIRPETDGTYSIPDGNLFPKDGSKGRPEIYVMGARNPFRISVDPKKGYVYWGDVGPDGGAAGKYGPESYDEWNQAQEAGNYGWPYFVADNKGYPRRDFTDGSIGPLPDPQRPVNLSPYNTGDSILPPAQPAMIWYPYGQSEEFPLLGAGGRSAMAGPVYYEDLAYPGSKIKLPEYYNGKLFIYEWVRNWINVCTFDEEGKLIKIEPFLTDQNFAGPLDMEIGPDGSIYLLEYGNAYFLDNPEAMISRIEFAAGNRQPIAQVSCTNHSGKAPFRTHFSAAGSFDYDAQDSLTYEWYFTNDKSPQAFGAEVDFTFEERGTYEVTLLVKDAAGGKATAQTTVQVGNQPPNVQIVYQGNQSFYQENGAPLYEIQIQDPEDESNGGIDPNSARMSLSYLKDADWFHQLLQGEAQLPQGDLQFMEGQRLIENSDCRTCHQNEKKTIGPSYVMVAQRYKDRYDAVEYLAEKIIKGGNGVWGKSMMSAHPDISREQAAEMAQYVLSLGEKERLPLAGSLRFKDHPASMQGGGYALVASYQDKGANSIGPLQGRSIKLLRSPLLEAEYCDQRNNIGQRRFGRGLKQTHLTARGGSAYLAFEQIDLTDVERIGLIAQGRSGGKVDIRLGSPEGQQIGSIAIAAGPDKSEKWSALYTRIQNTKGLQDIYFVFTANGKQGDIANIDQIHFQLNQQKELLGLR